jgi:hypothetical protein
MTGSSPLMTGSESLLTYFTLPFRKLNAGSEGRVKPSHDGVCTRRDGVGARP